MQTTNPLAAVIGVIGVLVAAGTPAQTQSPVDPAAEPAAPVSAAAVAGAGADAAAAEPMRFSSPDAAAMTLVDAAGAEDAGGLFAVLGAGLEQLVSGDAVADAADRRRFVEMSAEGIALEDVTDDSAILVLGSDAWPFPVPLARDEQGWFFDTEAGIEEVLDRRIGRNELHAIAAMRAFVEAQMEYAAADPDGDGVHAYADRLLSSEGKRDGLYWPTAEGAPESPMGPLVAAAVTEGYQPAEHGEDPRPFHGYLFKLLTAQGPDAPGGAKDYRRDGRLVDGFALLAWPVRYGSSGIMTFQVDRRGIVYERDLGDETADIAPAITAFDPGEGWAPTLDE